MSYNKLTWNTVLKNNKFDLIEHHFMEVSRKIKFDKEFSLVLKGLNGEPDSQHQTVIWIFVEANPAFQSSLRFRGKTKKPTL